MKIDSVVTATLVLCAVLTTGVVIRREFFPQTAAGMPVQQKPVLLPNWEDNLASGEQIGPPQAKVRLIEFADFECPFCANFHKTLNVIRDKYPNEVLLDYVHFPLSMHRFAIPAARVSECASDQGRFAAMYDQLFEGQDQFGLKPWADFATAAGVPDLAAFDACIRRTDPVRRVEQGKALGTKLDVQGTPTIIINGWKLGQPPNEQELDQMVQRILAGKSPIAQKS